MKPSDSDKAKEILKEGCTCVLVKNDTVYTSTKSGISPMLDYISEGVDLAGFSVADKIVGKAAAMLFSKAGIVSVHAEVLSRSGAEYLKSKNIPCTYDKMVDVIINRKGDDICPMEKTVQSICDEDEAFIELLKTRARLSSK